MYTYCTTRPPCRYLFIYYLQGRLAGPPPESPGFLVNWEEDGFSFPFFSPKRFILSGLLRSQARQVADTLKKNDATILKTWNHDGIWHTFYGIVG